MENDYERRPPAEVAKAMYDDDSASRMLGIQLEEVRVGYCRATMKIRSDMVNGLGVCHGGLIFTLADSAMAFACNARDEATFAAQAEIDWLGPARKDDVLTAEALTIAEPGRTKIHDVVVINQDKEMIAVFRGRTRTVGGPVGRDALV